MLYYLRLAVVIVQCLGQPSSATFSSGMYSNPLWNCPSLVYAPDCHVTVTMLQLPLKEPQLLVSACLQHVQPLGISQGSPKQ